MRPGSWFRRVVVAAVITFLMCSAVAWAEDINYLIQQLKTSDDFSVRTQAALSLGATSDAAAIAPLCEVLAADSNDAVRAACAAGLGKLKKSDGLTCLNDRLGKETNASVKSAIDKAIKDIQKGANAVPAGSKYYIVLTTVNKTTRGNDDIDGVVRSAMAARLLAAGGFAVAPKSESASDSGKVISSKNLKGFMLASTVNAFTNDGALGLAMSVVIQGFPGRDIKAEVSPKVSAGGAVPGDKTMEDALIKAASENAVDSFTKVAANL